ncbi:GMC oxidoreductase family [Synechococcus sp. PCC 7335]|uniref:GMC oxidoreductase n=1 Tax=Synechococcus sp. (strain ATCC 29403 / PCC 7335) TaxID=91464 RepID=UPI00017ECB47|nr:GMC family oxidoreductase [Synechococcus sp. PCC 7335]EDX87365.1 GMC oxidoreductase family [Synechococcus sp. PCC 7335]
MFTDILDMGEQATLRRQVVVVGSGIAGAEVSTYLARHGLEVVLVESGREQFDPAIQALNDVVFLGKRHRELNPNSYYHRYLPPALRGVSRVRQFGGTSNVWTGKWKYLQPSDFEGREWVPNSGWPITFEDLLEHYRSAAKDYGFGDLEAEAIRPEIMAFRSKIAAAGLKVSSFYWEQTPTRTAKRFGKEMRQSKNLQVLMGATATELLLDESKQHVSAVACRSLEGKELMVEGETVVLAMGALESARLLLASDRQLPGGIGNEHDLVGRFYTDHPKHHTGTLRPGALTRKYARELQYAPKPRFCTCFALDDQTQEAEELLEHVLYLKPIYETRLGSLRRILTLRPTCQDGNGIVDSYRVKFVVEQVPHKDSRITLSSEYDSLGKRRIALDWRFTEQDKRSMAKTLQLLTKRFEQSGLGTFNFGDDPPTLETMTDAAHQMGTTRMANCPEAGVVDTNCRVFGTDNLYIASSAVFPTGPSYSPTFTILALARRLGEHLRQTISLQSVANVAVR